MAVFTAEMRKLSRELITTMTGFQVRQTRDVRWYLFYGLDFLVEWPRMTAARPLWLRSFFMYVYHLFPQPSDENFRLCFRFVKSNFQFHRFLDVNDMKVTRSIRGYVLKVCIIRTRHHVPRPSGCVRSSLSTANQRKQRLWRC